MMLIGGCLLGWLNHWWLFGSWFIPFPSHLLPGQLTCPGPFLSWLYFIFMYLVILSIHLEFLRPYHFLRCFFRLVSSAPAFLPAVLLSMGKNFVFGVDVKIDLLTVWWGGDDRGQVAKSRSGVRSSWLFHSDIFLNNPQTVFHFLKGAFPLLSTGEALGSGWAATCRITSKDSPCCLLPLPWGPPVASSCTWSAAPSLQHCHPQRLLGSVLSSGIVLTLMSTRIPLHLLHLNKMTPSMPSSWGLGDRQ